MWKAFSRLPKSENCYDGDPDVVLLQHTMLFRRKKATTAKQQENSMRGETFPIQGSHSHRTEENLFSQAANASEFRRSERRLSDEECAHRTIPKSWKSWRKIFSRRANERASEARRRNENKNISEHHFYSRCNRFERERFFSSDISSL